MTCKIGNLDLEDLIGHNVSARPVGTNTLMLTGYFGASAAKGQFIMECLNSHFKYAGKYIKTVIPGGPDNFQDLSPDNSNMKYVVADELKGWYAVNEFRYNPVAGRPDLHRFTINLTKIGDDKQFIRKETFKFWHRDSDWDSQLISFDSEVAANTGGRLSGVDVTLSDATSTGEYYEGTGALKAVMGTTEVCEVTRSFGTAQDFSTHDNIYVACRCTGRGTFDLRFDDGTQSAVSRDFTNDGEYTWQEFKVNRGNDFSTGSVSWTAVTKVKFNLPATPLTFWFDDLKKVP